MDSLVIVREDVVVWGSFLGSYRAAVKKDFFFWLFELARRETGRSFGCRERERIGKLMNFPLNGFNLNFST